MPFGAAALVIKALQTGESLNNLNNSILEDLMKIKITYCSSWNYQPQAVSLAEKLKDAFGEDAVLIPGSGGVFDVVVDESLIYSKHETGEFPNENELLRQLQSQF